MLGTLTTLLNTVLAIACGMWAHKRYNSMLLMMLVIIASYALFKAIQLVFLQYYYRRQDRLHPLPPIHELYKENWEDRDEWENTFLSLGMRIVAITEDLDESYEKAYSAIIDKAINEMNQPETIFALRYETVIRKKYPYYAAWTNCGTDGVEINSAAKAWYACDACTYMKGRRPGKDIFVHDGEIEVEDRGLLRYTVLVLFAQSLPVTVNNPFVKKKREEEEPGATGQIVDN